MLKSIPFVLGVALISAGTSMIATKTVIQHTLDLTPKAETIVVKEPVEAKAEPKPEPQASLGKMAFDNERPLTRAGWKAGKSERVGDATCTPAVGPDGQEVVVVEFDGGRSMLDVEGVVYGMMEKDGWKKSDTEYMSMWKGGRYASVAHVLDRNRGTCVIGTGTSLRAARYAEESFRKN